MADADPSQSETTDFPVLIGCSFFVGNKSGLTFFLHLFIFFILPCWLFIYYCVFFTRSPALIRTQMHARIPTHTHKNMAAVGGCQPVRVLDVM